MFQSHNGAIAAIVAMQDSKLQETGFNPTMVRLLPTKSAINLMRPLCFNPTMVRLLQAQQEERQFRRTSFNPTMVRLLHFRVALEWLDYKGFNPTMVRLLLKVNDGTRRPTRKFQSHNGAIAAMLL